jgi:hypothetical protein
MSMTRAETEWLLDVDRLTRDLQWAPALRTERDAFARAAGAAARATEDAARAYLALNPWERDLAAIALEEAQRREEVARGALEDFDQLARLVDGIAYTALALSAGPRPAPKEPQS